MSGLDWSPVGMSADPVPGDPDVVRRGGNDYVAVATAIAQARTTISSIDLGTFVVSEAVDAIRTTASEVAENIGRAHGRYEATGNALVTYATALSGAQTEARAALADATDAADVAEGARSNQRRYLRLAQNADDPEAMLRYEQLAEDHAVDATLAEGSFATAQGRITAAVTARDTAADTAIAAIEATVSGDSLGDSWWDDWGKDVLTAITDVAGWISTIAGILAIAVCWIPVIGQALAGALLLVAGIAAIINAVGNVVLAIDGERSWGEAGLSILGAALSFVGGGAITKVVGRFLPGTGRASQALLPVRTRDLVRFGRDRLTPLPNIREGQLLYRVHGSGASQLGNSWTPIDPRRLANIRMQLGLPTGNSMEFLTVVRLKDVSVIDEVRHALRLDGMLGGAPEVLMKEGYDRAVLEIVVDRWLL